MSSYVNDIYIYVKLMIFIYVHTEIPEEWQACIWLEFDFSWETEVQLE